MTSSSGRSEAGKNWRCRVLLPVEREHEEDERHDDGDVAVAHADGEHLDEGAASPAPVRRASPCIVAGSTVTPITGEKITATNHEVTSAMPITANSEKVYWPTLLWARPIGRKPAMVTSVPVSIGKAVET